MLLLRDVNKADLEDLRSLAAELNSVNLPDDARALAGIIERSARSFSGKVREPLERSYVFVLEDARTGRLLGTSMVIAQHGTFDSPCTFFDLSEREHYSSTIDRHLRHKVLSIGYHFDGPTEIGGLVVRPEDRGGEPRPGKQLAYVRFLYIAMHRDRFRERVLAELMPPLLPDGRSLFWESCGKRFTGLDYLEADRRSRENKEFIQQLFPPGDIYATLFPPRVQRLLGAVGPQTLGVKHLLEKIGFQYAGRIDPFDGGPHYEAKVADLTLVRAYRRLRVADGDLGRSGEEKLVAAERAEGRVRFRAVRTLARTDGDDVLLQVDARELLGVARGDRVHVVPFE
jgi:arginine N-succinyltransferase